jgi:magnesium chelatase family protein
MANNFGRVFSAQPTLLGAEIVTVEADCEKGMHAYTIVGLAGKAVEEARDRVGAALKNNAFSSPRHSQKKTIISLAPADIKKEGPLFDVPIALAYLLATGEMTANVEKKLFTGELGLDGSVRPIRGALQVVKAARDAGFTDVYIPEANLEEACLVDGITIWGMDTLLNLYEQIDETQGPDRLEEEGSDEKKDTLVKLRLKKGVPRVPTVETEINQVFEDIVGHAHAKRGLTIAAAGGHNIAFWGPPGTGKTLLASTLPYLVPPLTHDDMLEATSIHSIAGTLSGGVQVLAPFRSPHHTSSYVALVGGGTNPKPGEVTLAHRGILFLDEFTEFDKKVLNALREPLEDGKITVARAKGSVQFPSRFILVAAMNPCPCGHGEGPKCKCTALSIQKYQQKISGPIVDRIDMWLEIPAVDHRSLVVGDRVENETRDARKKIERARTLQHKRYVDTKKNSSTLNAHLSSRDIKKHIVLSEDVQDRIAQAAERMALSPRAVHRVIKLARTIADLDAVEDITENHILEALQYRSTM